MSNVGEVWNEGSDVFISFISFLRFQSIISYRSERVLFSTVLMMMMMMMMTIRPNWLAWNQWFHINIRTTSETWKGKHAPISFKTSFHPIHPSHPPIHPSTHSSTRVFHCCGRSNYVDSIPRGSIENWRISHHKAAWGWFMGVGVELRAPGKALHCYLDLVLTRECLWSLLYCIGVCLLNKMFCHVFISLRCNEWSFQY